VLTSGRLPLTAIPTAYRIYLKPDLDSRSFQGSEGITIQVPEAVDHLVLHAVGLSVTQVLLDGSRPGMVEIDAPQQIVILRFAEPIEPGEHVLSMSFGGLLETVPQGMFYQPYSEGGVSTAMIGTQLEPTDARLIFPLWDEPGYRATFELTVDVLETFVPVSNMPVASEQLLGGAMKRVKFLPTPSMPSYLFVLCAGEFAELKGEAAGVELRVLTTPSKVATAEFGLEATRKLLPYFNDYFGVPYPLPKLDLIAIPGGFGGAMENWGGITFNEAALLFDPARSSQGTKEGIFSIVAHELAHQWFGNLVTMAWWDDLWLNEGFATWLASKAADHFYPEWHVAPRTNRTKNHAMDADARSTTHPIQQTVIDPAEAVTAFDEITYDKGEAVIRMIEGFLGAETFRDGMRLYMKRHAYGNARTEDLWAALGEASGKPVGEIARTWTEQPGFPLVVADLKEDDGKTSLAVRQERFTLADPAAAPLIWELPLVYSINGHKHSIVLASQEAVLPIADPDAVVKVNAGDFGYFRVWHRGDLGRRLLRDYPSLGEADRVGLLSDAYALAIADKAPVEEYLALLDRARLDRSVAVWKQILDTLDELDFLELGTSGRESFHAAARRLLQPLGHVLTWEPLQGEEAVDALLRVRTLLMLGRFGDSEVKLEATRRFDQFLADPDSLPGNLRPVILGIIGRYATPEQYDAISRLARKSERIEDKQLFYGALSRVLDPELARRTLAISITDEAEPTLAAQLVLQVSYGENRDLGSEFACENSAVLLAKKDLIGRYKYLPSAFEAYSDLAKADELVEAGQRLLPPEAASEVRKEVERIRFRSDLKARFLPAVDKWAASAFAETAVS
jgi:aminopeptidase N